MMAAKWLPGTAVFDTKLTGAQMRPVEGLQAEGGIIPTPRTQEPLAAPPSTPYRRGLIRDSRSG
jgi:hypothetical protein